MRKLILLNPGPVVISDQVREALCQPDMCHREAEFVEILIRVRKKLTQVFGGNRLFTTVILCGSGTAALESVISSVVRQGKLLVLSNGYYGEKIQALAKIHGVDTCFLRKNWGDKIERCEVKRILRSECKIKFVAMAHNETSTGMLNDVSSIGELVSDFGKVFILDAISSVGAEELSVVDDSIQFCTGSPNKCIESVPGLSFVCADKTELEKLGDLPPKTSFLDLYGHYICEVGKGERPGTPFTPPVQVFYALDVALDLLLKEGIENRRVRYANAAKNIRDGLERLGFKLFLPREFMSSSITSIVTPKNIPYETLHDHLKTKGFVVYAGQGSLAGRVFRIANMGALTTQDIDRFVDSIEDVLRELKETPQY